MKGLTVPDPRPWAKDFARQYLAKNLSETCVISGGIAKPNTNPEYRRAPPLVQQGSRSQKRHNVEPRRVSQAAEVGRLGGLIPPGGEVKRTKSTAQVVGPPEPAPLPVRPLERPDLPIRSLTKAMSIVSQEAKPSPSVETKTPLKGGLPTPPPTTARPKQQLDPKKVVHSGDCKLVHMKSGDTMFIVSFAMQVRPDKHGKEEAFLALSAQGELKELLALDVSVTRRSDDSCILASQPKGSFAYILQFRTESDAGKFCVYLEYLQKATRQIRSRGSEPKTAIASTPCPQPPPATGCPTSVPTRSHETVRDAPPASCVRPNTEHCASMTPSASAPGAQAQSQQVTGPKLVDVESLSQPAHTSTAPTIEDAAEKLFELIEKILPEATAAGLNLSDDAISDIQETTIESWLARGFLRSETNDMRSELLELLRILVRIKRKAALRKQATLPKAAIDSLRDLELEPKSQRITYTDSEIRGFAGARITPAQLDKSIVEPRRANTSRPYSNNAAIPNLSQAKSWLNAGQKSPDNSTMGAVPSTAAPSPNMLIDLNTDKPDPPSRELSASFGLGTSRWARG